MTHRSHTTATPSGVGAGRWILATTTGWISGVPLVAGFALLGEVVGIGGAQTLMGAGMGTGVGALTYLGLIALGGPLIGLATARPIARLLAAARPAIATSSSPATSS